MPVETPDHAGQYRFNQAGLDLFKPHLTQRTATIRQALPLRKASSDRSDQQPDRWIAAGLLPVHQKLTSVLLEDICLQYMAHPDTALHSADLSQALSMPIGSIQKATASLRRADVIRTESTVSGYMYDALTDSQIMQTHFLRKLARLNLAGQHLFGGQA